MLSDTERKTLLRVAREAASAAVGHAPLPKVTVESEALEAPCGTFVTLKNRGRLRGCIGCFAGRGPLVETVQQMAVAAATQDPRFRDRPVTASELAELDVEISVLRPMEPVADPLKEIELGRHGIYVKGPTGGGCFLPQVATETGWSLEKFLSECCAGKAGLPPDAWQWPSVQVFRFEAEVFGERESAG